MTEPGLPPAPVAEPRHRFLQGVRRTLFGSRGGVRDVALGLIPQGLAAVTGFISSVLMARGLGPARFGDYALVMSVSGLVTSLSDLGIGQTAIRFASRAAAAGDSEQQFAVLRWAFRLRMVLVGLITLAFFLLSPVLANQVWQVSGLAPLLRLGLILGVFTALSALPIIYFQSVRRFGMNAVVSAAQILLAFFGIIAIAIMDRWSVELVLAVSIIASAIGSVVFLSLVPRQALVGDTHALSRKTWWRTFWKSPSGPASAPFLDAAMDAGGFARFHLVSSAVVMVIQRVDFWLLGIFVTRDEIGIYNAAGRFTLPLVMLLSATMAALWPRAAAATSAEAVRGLLIKTVRLSLIVAIVALVYAATVPLLAPTLFGPSYSDSIFLGQLLSLRYVFAILSSPLGVIGYSVGLVRVYWLINLLQLGAIISVNLLLLPRVGAVGAALAYVAHEIVGLCIVGTIVWRRVAHSKA